MSNTPPPPPPPGYQPYGAAVGAPGPKPPTYLVWSILSTLFCCLPLGIASIVFAARVDGLYNSGDYAGSIDASEKAKKFAIWSAVATVLLIVVYLIIALAVASGSN